MLVSFCDSEKKKKIFKHVLGLIRRQRGSREGVRLLKRNKMINMVVEKDEEEWLQGEDKFFLSRTTGT